MLTSNLIAYSIYGFATTFIIVIVGWLCFHFGATYLNIIFKTDKRLAKTINKLLLIGYYLFNIGYVAITLGNWDTANSTTHLFTSVCYKIGFIVQLLGVMHFINMALTYGLAKYYFTPNHQPKNLRLWKRI